MASTSGTSAGASPMRKLGDGVGSGCGRGRPDARSIEPVGTEITTVVNGDWVRVPVAVARPGTGMQIVNRWVTKARPTPGASARPPGSSVLRWSDPATSASGSTPKVTRDPFGPKLNAPLMPCSSIVSRGPLRLISKPPRNPGSRPIRIPPGATSNPPRAPNGGTDRKTARVAARLVAAILVPANAKSAEPVQSGIG
jgi:hypothetical protein